MLSPPRAVIALMVLLFGLVSPLGVQVATAQLPQRVIVSSTANAPTAVDSADIDSDGDKDILVASEDDDRIAWYENQIGESGADSDGFAPPKTITTSASEAKSVASADLDGDGDQDVLSASALDGKIAWYENQVGESGTDSDGFGDPHIITNTGEAQSVAVGDLDGDGDRDVLSASQSGISSDPKIAWYENQVGEPGADSDGFGSQQTITTNAGGAQSVTAANLDGDDDQDVVFASSFESKVAWHENQIDESGADSDGFGDQQTITTNADNVSSVAAANLDEDEDQDVLSASEDDDKIAWYENQTGESDADSDGFGAQQVITTSAQGAQSVTAADLDSDGDKDVLSASQFDEKVAWYENQIGESSADSDSFGAQQTITTSASYAQSVAAADLDGDGDKEVLSASRRDDKVAWYENQIGESDADSDGFGDQQTITTGASDTGSVAAADLDGDGDRDVLSASQDDDKVAWYENQVGDAGADSDGFGDQQIISTSADGPLSVTTADLDGDGDQDVLSASPLDDRVAWYENQLGETGADSDGFGAQQTITTDADLPESVAAADLDDDGDMDVLSDEVAWYENQLGESGADSDGFGDSQMIADGAESVATAELDGDGDQDVLFASGDEVAWLENQLGETGADSDGFGDPKTITTSATDVHSVAAADLDGDEDQDVLSASRDDEKIAWYANQLGESGADSDGFGDQQTITNSASVAYSVTAADLDGDGDRDVLSTTGFDANLVWYENQVGESEAASSGFGTGQTVTTSAEGPRSVAAADLDGDGDKDVLSASRGEDKIAWYVNDVSSVRGSQSASVASGGEVDFGNTGADINFSGVSGSGTVRVSKFDSSPANPGGISESNVSSYRITIEADPSLSFDANTQVQFDVSTLSGLDNVTTSDGEADNVTIYKRSTEGAGSFTALMTTYDSNTDELVATTGSFSEFVLASDSEPLPVELASFNARADDGTVRLSWQTASETNNAGFDVQRQADGAETWTDVGFVEGAGTTTQSQQYRFSVEEDLTPGTHRFRLRQVDIDGTAHLSDVVTVDLQMQQPVRLTAPAPNPVQNRATLSFAVKEAQETTIRLYNVLGQRVATLYRGTPAAEESKTVDLSASDLSSGVYFLRLQAGERTATQRVTVVR